MSVEITLPDGSIKQFENEPTVLEVAQSIGPKLAKDTLGGLVGETLVDLRARLSNGSKLKIVTTKDPRALEVMRHSAAHVMAQAVQELWPQVKVTIGPVIDDGFYYDFESEKPFAPEDLEKIENKMREIIKRDSPVRREEWPADEAIATFRKMGEKFKVEIIEDLKAQGEKVVSVYHQGEWFDLCRGPHVQRLGQIGAVKILSLAGSYWRGDEKRERLQRIYATAFLTDTELKQYLADLEEAKKRDHRRLGKDLNLFVFHPFAPGSPFFTPNGAVIYNGLMNFMRDKYLEHDYQEVITPQIFDVELFHQSGHYANYRENMYFMRIDERDMACKPMNCPSHCLIFDSDRRSYRELPWRVADFGRLHRYERSGVMHGLSRVRSFSQDDAHIFCTMEQIQTEIEKFMKFLGEVYATLGMNQYHVYLSTRPEKRLGTDEIWDRAESALESALKKMSLPYTINPGDGAFYGPKLDIMFVDSIRRPWQLGTLQVDFNMPHAFHLKYIGEDNAEHEPVMLHRAILGSFERFISVYLEHTAGHLPLWLAPTQVRVLSVSDRHLDYCESLTRDLKSRGVRVHNDVRGEKLGAKIRDAQLMKVPLMLVIGDKEKETQTVSVRMASGGLTDAINKDQFYEMVLRDIQSRALHSSLAKMAKMPTK